MKDTGTSWLLAVAWRHNPARIGRRDLPHLVGADLLDEGQRLVLGLFRGEGRLGVPGPGQR